ncbi:N-6 DNA methylase [Luteococcus sp.]|uniref:N-6 DNA methylase n=1 Tax=Luteococcus sp. TaxID=1969402 RepID=UPI00373686AC
MSRPQAQGLLTASDIADLAGVSRGAVSNWRNRADDFPKPAGGTATKPLFSSPEIISWLTDHGHALRTDDGQAAVWAAMNHLRGVVDLRDAASLVVALLTEHATGNSFDPFSHDSYARIAQPIREQDLQAVRDAIADVPVDRAAAVADFVLERTAKAMGKMGGEAGFVGSRTSTLLANLAASRSHGVLYDPACGIAAALIGASDDSHRWSRLVGRDIYSAALRLAEDRARLRSLELDLRQADVLASDPDPDLVADTIILEPPFGLRMDADERFADSRFVFGLPPRTSADSAWLQHVIAHLAPEGRGYVITPMGPLFRGGKEAHIRAALLDAGCIEAIIALPGKMVPHTAIALALWVLRAPRTNHDGQVLLIDASRTHAPEDHVASWLTDSVARRDLPHITVSVGDLIEDGANLTPQRWTDQTTVDPEQLVTTYRDAITQVTRLTGDLDAQVAAMGDAPDLADTRAMIIAELLSEDVLEQRPGKAFGRYRDADASLEAHLVTAAMIRDNTLPDPAPDHTYSDLTHPGDVLVTTMNTIRAIVDHSGGHLHGTGITRLRITNPDVLSPDYLAAMLMGEWNNDLQAGTTITRAPVKELTIPMATLADQQCITTAINQAQQIHQLATRLARHADDVTIALRNAVRYNAPLTNPQS